MKGHQEVYYWIFSAGIPLVFLVLLIGITHRVVQRRTGSNGSLRWFAPLAVALALMVLGQSVYDLLSPVNQARITNGFFLLLLVSILAMLMHSSWRAQRTGSVLLELGCLDRQRRRIGLGFVLISVVLTVHAGLAWHSAGFRSVRGLAETLTWVATALFWLLHMRRPTLIGERGVLAIGDFVEWERIIAYEWIGERGDQLLLRVRRYVPFLGPREGVAFAPVSPEARNTALRLMDQYLPGKNRAPSR